ncbi:hypothetical protein GCM10018954_091480 [Kutzneria kofuensis]
MVTDGGGATVVVVGGATVVVVVSVVLVVVSVVATGVGVTVDVIADVPSLAGVTCGFGSQPDSSAPPRRNAPTTASSRDIRCGLPLDWVDHRMIAGLVRDVT